MDSDWLLKYKCHVRIAVRNAVVIRVNADPLLLKCFSHCCSGNFHHRSEVTQSGAESATIRHPYRDKAFPICLLIGPIIQSPCPPKVDLVHITVLIENHTTEILNYVW